MATQNKRHGQRADHVHRTVVASRSSRARALYAVQCVAGFQDVVVEQLQKHGDRLLRISVVEQGFVTFTSELPATEFSKLPFVSMSFAVLAEWQGDLASFLSRLEGSADWHGAARATTTRGERTFKLMVSQDGRLVSQAHGAVTGLITDISRTTGLAAAHGRPDAEFWVIRRRSGRCCFCKRISRPDREEPRRGELRPDLARLLCLLSEPDTNDIFLDPFSGSGAIPFARSNYPYTMIFALDQDDDKVKAMKEDLKEGRRGVRERKRCPIIIRKGDAEHLARIDDGFISKIVTDPPWGKFQQIEDIETLYVAATREMARTLRPDGLLVMLLGSEDLGSSLAAQMKEFLKLEKKLNILVSGKPAVAIRWRRRQAPGTKAGA